MAATPDQVREVIGKYMEAWATGNKELLLSIFAEIYTTTGGGPGDASTNVAFLIFKQALLNFDAGVASAGALFAVVLANIAAAFLIRMVGKNLDK